MQRLTRKQAAIISAYTGFLSGPFEDMHEYAEKKFGHPVWTHELASEAMAERLRELSKDDFLALVAEKDTK